LIPYHNVPASIATLISAGLATLHELDTVYGTEDLWMMLEVNAVDAHNKYLMSKHNG